MWVRLQRVMQVFAADDKLRVDKVKGEPGEIVQFGEVLVVGGENVVLGTPTVSGASVAAEVLEQGRGRKVIAFKKRRRKNSRRKRGHRQEFTLVQVTEILTDGKAPSLAARPKRQAKAKPALEEAPAGDTEAAETPAKPKTAGKAAKGKTAAKPKAAAKKPAKAPAKKAAKPESKGKK